MQITAREIVIKVALTKLLKHSPFRRLCIVFFLIKKLNLKNSHLSDFGPSGMRMPIFFCYISFTSYASINTRNKRFLLFVTLFQWEFDLISYVGTVALHSICQSLTNQFQFQDLFQMPFEFKNLRETCSELISVHGRITRNDKDKMESGVIG